MRCLASVVLLGLLAMPALGQKRVELVDGGQVKVGHDRIIEVVPINGADVTDWNVTAKYNREWVLGVDKSLILSSGCRDQTIVVSCLRINWTDQKYENAKITILVGRGAPLPDDPDDPDEPDEPDDPDEPDPPAPDLNVRQKMTVDRFSVASDRLKSKLPALADIFEAKTGEAAGLGWSVTKLYDEAHKAIADYLVRGSEEGKEFKRLYNPLTRELYSEQLMDPEDKDSVIDSFNDIAFGFRHVAKTSELVPYAE